jgi:hypothetical protein
MTTPKKQAVHERLHELMDARGMRIDDVVRAYPTLTHSCVRAWLDGSRQIQPRRMHEFCAALNTSGIKPVLSPADLIRGTSADMRTQAEVGAIEAANASVHHR